MTIDIQYRTGLLWQDCQHKDWIALLDELKENKEDKALFSQTVSFLVTYVTSHFALEEEYMKRYEYPEARFHIEEHRMCILRLKDFREKHREYSDEARLKIIKSMSEWIYSHILENDQKLGSFILQKEQPRLKTDQ